MKRKRANGNSAEIANISHIIDEFCTRTNMFLQRFPGTEKQVMPWVDAMAFESPTETFCPMPRVLQ